MHKTSKLQLVANETQFENSLQELRKFSSQLYHSADYCKATYLNAKDKRLVAETTKEYICRAVVKVVDHLGTISINLESSLFNCNTVSAVTEHKIDGLKQRIMSCQHHSGKLALTRFYRTSHFSRYQCRYISPPLNSEMASVVLRKTESPIKAKKEFESSESLVYTIRDSKTCDPFKNSARFMEKKNEFSPTVVAVRDGLQSMSPKPKYSSFHFQETDHQKQKGSKINWKNKNIKTLISRGKRILGEREYRNIARERKLEAEVKGLKEEIDHLRGEIADVPHLRVQVASMDELQAQVALLTSAMMAQQPNTIPRPTSRRTHMAPTPPVDHLAKFLFPPHYTHHVIM